MPKIMIVTDAWHPQVNGVVRSIETTNRELAAMGYDVAMITPKPFRSIPMPTYPEIRLSLARYGQIARMIEAEKPDFMHIATEGPLGLMARRWCLRHDMAFSTSYHTRFPEYVRTRIPVPLGWLYAYVRWFHNRGGACMVATESLRRELAAKGIANLCLWSRGIDLKLFHPRPRSAVPFGLARPIFMTIGRVAVEKNLPAFLDLDLPGSKVVVGDGPARAELEAQYPHVHFTGVKFGEQLAAAYAEADVFVFPSKTDTFGNTILEALASGVPVAAYPVTGPADIIPAGSGAGALDDDLLTACLAALERSRTEARHLAEGFTWQAATKQFLDNVIEAKTQARRRRLSRRQPNQPADA
ncbi:MULTISPECIES: glycosyltransferase family 4 protein [Alphaproteobacteria]|uniref:Glycosyl transferase n=2 Tax=Alphaproteobacteria TaxID=28211 RepID=A0A512HEY7_9HYPH|nr:MULTISPECIES: glycosyltransferase family 1 protein [Alphaproteobacteria]GEO84025.1 glycosyl transferase [Ciceribacter naphthalenivorans]GLR21097.1 glycosyl transferase [Ciceribacter naphthalenivorans]GLT03953.1 glycosyl transferase [Sphingomonas psychrolutea]